MYFEIDDERQDFMGFVKESLWLVKTSTKKIKLLLSEMMCNAHSAKVVKLMKRNQGWYRVYALLVNFTGSFYFRRV